MTRGVVPRRGPDTQNAPRLGLGMTLTEVPWIGQATGRRS